MNVEMTIKELLGVIAFVVAVMAVQGWMASNDAEQYKYVIAQKQAVIDGMTGVKDCVYIGGEFEHTWADSCVVKEHYVEVMK